MASNTVLLLRAQDYSEQGGFGYNLGSDKPGNLFNEIFNKPGKTEDPRCLYLLRQLLRQRSALYCGNPHGDNDTCCYAHIVKRRDISQWRDGCDMLDKALKAGLSWSIKKHGCDVQQVLDAINVDGHKSRSWKKAFDWLIDALPYVYANGLGSSAPDQHQDLVNEVINALKVFQEVQGFPLRPVQMATVLLNTYGVETGTKLMVEMKTGEGKTFVCGVSSAVVAKRKPQGPAIILTSSSDRAREDKSDTEKFIKAYLGKLPVFVEELDPIKAPGEGCVAYGQVSDAQRIVVDALRNGQQTQLFTFLENAHFFLDEADHVLVEQAENLLYVASPCQCYHALFDILFHIQYRLDFDGVFSYSLSKTRHAVRYQAGELTSAIMAHIRREYPQSAKHPPIIDIDTCVSQWATGALSARLRKQNKTYVLELTNSKTPDTIPNVPMVVIIDTATGTESDGSRWTTEAPFVEAREELPINGSDPLAFYNAFPYLLEKVGWFGGVTGTLGAHHVLNFYAKTYDVRTFFRIPRHVATTVYRLNTVIAENEEKQLCNISQSVMEWLEGRKGLGCAGPILIVADTIYKAQQIEDTLKKDGHILTSLPPKGSKWEMEASTRLSTNTIAHIFPYYRREHKIPEKLPDCAIVVASNKGGRGLDIKLDGSCPHECPVLSHPKGEKDFSSDKTAMVIPMRSILFVILTSLLPGRQDDQAVGRCGRSGKAGVVQYQLARKTGRTGDSALSNAPPEAFVLSKRLDKNKQEKSALDSKLDNIRKQRHAGRVLSFFCYWRGTFVITWIRKLFPESKKKKQEKRKENKSEQPKDQVKYEDETSIAFLSEVVYAWLDALVEQRWAIWRSYGGNSRGDGDIFISCKQRMGFKDPEKLPESGNCNALMRFADRFWRFASLLRLSADDIYDFAKALLSAKQHHASTKRFCVCLLLRASAPKSALKKHWKILRANSTVPDDNWKPEFTGNAALLLARLSRKHHSLAMKRAIQAVKNLKAGLESDENMSNKTFPEYVLKKNDSTRGSQKTYYLVQRAEIVRQLDHRVNSLRKAVDSSTIPIHLFEALKRDDISKQAYRLGYRWCQAIFEWHVEDSPFAEKSKTEVEFEEVLTKKAQKLGASTTENDRTGSGTSDGSTQVRSEAESNKFADKGNAMMEFTKEETASDANQEQNSTEVEEAWEASGPTNADVDASKTGMWQTMKSFFFIALVLIMHKITAPHHSYAGLDSSSHCAANSHEKKEQHGLHESVRQELKQKREEYRQNMVASFAEIASEYLAQDIAETGNVVKRAGTFMRTTDLEQERVEVRTDGSTTKEYTREEAEAEAEKAAKNPLHFTDTGLSKEETYLSSKMLETLKDLSGKGEMGEFEEQFLQFQEFISRYNNMAMEGHVTQEIAEKFHQALKNLYKSALKMALEHGDKFEDMKTPLRNYRIATGPQRFIESVKEVTEKVTETIKQTVSTVIEKAVVIAKGFWRWFKRIVRPVVKLVRKVVEVIKEVPVVKEVVRFVREKVVDPVYAKAKSFFNTVKAKIGSVWNSISERVSEAMAKISTGIRYSWEWIKEKAGQAYAWVKETVAHVFTNFVQKMGLIFNSIEEKTGTVLTWLREKAMPLREWFGEVGKWMKDNLGPILTWIKEKTSPLLSWIAGKVGEAFTWLKERSKPLRDWFAEAASWVKEKCSSAFEWLLESNLGRVVVGALSFFVICPVMLIGMLFKNFGMYLWQGRADIERIGVWGDFMFDVIDVSRHPNGVSRAEIKRRQALSRVWSSSLIQWLLDPSYQIGLDIDEREHVQQRQERAHQDHLHQLHEEQKKRGLRFALSSVVISVLLTLAAVVSGMLLVPALLALGSSLLSAGLMVHSSRVDSDRSLNIDERERRQTVTSIAQSVLAIFSFFTPSVASAIVTIEQVLATAIRIIGQTLEKFSTFLRLQQRWKGLLQQFDRLLRSIGWGGGNVADMGLKGSLLKFTNFVLGLVTSVLGLVALQQSAKQLLTRLKDKLKGVKRTILQEKEEAEEQKQEQEEENDQEEDDEEKKQGQATLMRQRTSTTCTGSNCMELGRHDYVLTAAAKEHSSSRSETQYDTRFTISPKSAEASNRDTGLMFVLKTVNNNGSGQYDSSGQTWVASRELTKEEAEIFGGMTVEKLKEWFENEFKKASDVQEVIECTYTEENERETHSLENSRGKLTVSGSPNGNGKSTVNFESKRPGVDPLVFEIDNGVVTSTGELQPEFLDLILEFKGSDANLVHIGKGGMPQPQEWMGLLQKEQQQAEKSRSGMRGGVLATTKWLGSVLGPFVGSVQANWMWRTATSFVSSLVETAWSWTLVGPFSMQLLRWLSNTKYAKKVTEPVSNAWHSATEALQDAWNAGSRGQQAPAIATTHLNLVKTILYLDLKQKETEMSEEEFAEKMNGLRQEEDASKLAKQLATALVKEKQHWHRDDNGFRTTVEQMLRKIRGDETVVMKEEDWTQFKEAANAAGKGTGRATLELLKKAAKQKRGKVPGVSDDPPDSVILHDRMVDMKSGHCRRDAQFSTTVPEQKWSKTAKRVAMEMGEQAHVDDTVVTSQVISGVKIQKTIQGYVKSGDMLGFQNFVTQKFLDVNIDERAKFMDKSSRETFFEDVKAENHVIASMTIELTTRASKGYSNEDVVDTAEKLIGLLANSVQNVHVELIAQGTVVKAVLSELVYVANDIKNEKFEGDKSWKRLSAALADKNVQKLIGSGWSVFASSRDTAIFVNQETKQAVLSCRGSGELLRDFVGNDLFGFLNLYDGRVQTTIKSMGPSLLALRDAGYDISATGHSLGGSIASAVAAMMLIPVTTFNAPQLGHLGDVTSAVPDALIPLTAYIAAHLNPNLLHKIVKGPEGGKYTDQRLLNTKLGNVKHYRHTGDLVWKFNSDKEVSREVTPIENFDKSWKRYSPKHAHSMSNTIKSLTNGKWEGYSFENTAAPALDQRQEVLENLKMIAESHAANIAAKVMTIEDLLDHLRKHHKP